MSATRDQDGAVPRLLIHEGDPQAVANFWRLVERRRRVIISDLQGNEVAILYTRPGDLPKASADAAAS